jgi:hypothetical protein
MSFAVISGRNDGYPCIPSLDESVSADRTPPYSDFMFTVPAGSYPTLKMLRPLKASAELTLPYPDFMFRCVPELNDGYPSLLKMGRLEEKAVSSIYAGEKKIVALFTGNKEIKTAFCRGQKVFYKYFVKINA